MQKLDKEKGHVERKFVRRTEDDAVPPLGNLRVFGHQAGMNVGLLMHRAARLDPNLLAEVDERMRESSCKASISANVLIHHLAS